MIEIIISQSEWLKWFNQSEWFNEYLSFISSSLISVSSEKSIKIEIQILLISQAFIIQVSFSSFSLKNQESRKSEYQIKARDFWENEFIAFLIIITIIEVFIYYKNILNKKDWRKWE